MVSLSRANFQVQRPRAVVRELGTNTKFKHGADDVLGVLRDLRFSSFQGLLNLFLRANDTK